MDKRATATAAATRNRKTQPEAIAEHQYTYTQRERARSQPMLYAQRENNYIHRMWIAQIPECNNTHRTTMLLVSVIRYVSATVVHCEAARFGKSRARIVTTTQHSADSHGTKTNVNILGIYACYDSPSYAAAVKRENIRCIKDRTRFGAVRRIAFM